MAGRVFVLLIPILLVPMLPLAGSGVISTSGVITPRLELRPDVKTGDLIATLMDATMSSTGISIPLQDGSP